MSELLLELFSEEIPAKMQIKAASEMLATIEQAIKNLGLSYKEAEYFVTPRRIALHINNLPKELPEQIIEKKGPKIDAQPAAIEGFLRSVNMKLEELQIIDNCYYAKKLEPAKAIEPALKAAIEQMLISFTWPKSMRIGAEQARWVRPLRNILCLFNGNILPIKFAHLKANNITHGHRFMAGELLSINSFDDYQQKIRNAYVILSSEERKNIIINQANIIANKLNLKPILAEDLLNEVTGLVEYPHVLLGSIEQQFLDLPKEVLVTSMKVHQRYFYLENESGKIAPYFLTVANVKHSHDDIIIAGNEKVLKARLADAKFFWERDLKTPISDRLASLSRMVFHNKLGNMFEKTTRIIALSEFIANKLAYHDISLVKKAALLCKTDLVSEMVGEFPELQGVMGGYYAQNSNEEAEVSLAIKEHYAETTDISLLASIIAISDKIDSLVGLWLAGEKPTSSKDPFALRRAALGIIKLIRHHQLNISLIDLIHKAAENYNLTDSDKENEILSFFNDRLKYYLKAENFRHDIVVAILSNASDNIFDAISKAIELQEFIINPETCASLFAIKRIFGILGDCKLSLSLEVKLELCQKIELDLYHKVKESTSNLISLAALSPYIDEFFEQMLVNDPNPNLKQNRLNLLYNIAVLSNKIADFNLIEI